MVRVVEAGEPPEGTNGAYIRAVLSGTWFCPKCSSEVQFTDRDTIYPNGSSPIAWCPTCMDWWAFSRSKRLPKTSRRWWKFWGDRQ